MKHCPLCRAYGDGYCEGCPINNSSHDDGCEETPWEDLDMYITFKGDGLAEELLPLIGAEIQFLQKVKEAEIKKGNNEKA